MIPLTAAGIGLLLPPLNALYVALGVFSAGYLLLVRNLRYRRMKQIPKEFGYDGMTEEEIYQNITLQDAQDINKLVESFEFPFSYNTSLQFALFRTYAIPTISRVLQGTRQFSTTRRAGRRYADTVVLIIEFSQNALTSTRGSLAIARMNHLHSLYPSILASDLLYTLLLFITSPPLFLNKYEWRLTTPLEKAAITKFWTEIGVRMGIPRETIPPTFDACVEWADEYERQNMKLADSNTYVAEKTIDLLLYYVPTAPLRRLGRQIVISLLDERLRIAMGLPAAPGWAHASTRITLGLRAWFLRNFHLPRGKKRLRVTPQPDSKTGRIGLLAFDNEPWYAPGGFWARWGVWGLYAWIGGWPRPGDEGFGAEGYVIGEIGPVEFVGKGVEWTEEEAGRVRACGGYEDGSRRRAAACPEGGDKGGGGGGVCPFG